MRSLFLSYCSTRYYDCNLTENDCAENSVVCRHSLVYRFADQRKTCDSFECKIVLHAFECELFDSVDRMHATRHIDVCELIRFRRCAQYARHFVNWQNFSWLLDQSKRHEAYDRRYDIYFFKNWWNRFYYAHWKVRKD